MAELTNPVTLTADSVNTFTAPPGTTLDANTKYWITVNEGQDAATRLGYISSRFNGQDSGEPGWRIGDGRLTREARKGTTWSSFQTSLMFGIQGTPTAGLCKRTPEVSDALVALIPDITHCADVTDAHLAAITGTLDLGYEGITALKSEDFDGLASLEILDLGNNNAERAARRGVRRADRAGGSEAGR